MKSIYLHKDKSIFKLSELPVDKFAESLGLPGTPKIKFLRKEAGKEKKNASRAVEPADKDGTEIETSAGEDKDGSSKDEDVNATAKVGP